MTGFRSWTRRGAGREELVEMIGRFDPALPIERAVTPPSSWYRSPEIDALEREEVFSRSWQVAARVDEVAEVGRFVSGEVAGIRYVVVRGEDGVLRAFHNACRHRGTPVASGCGVAEELRCPYHGWRYRLDGRLRSAPRMAGAECLREEGFGLVPMRVATWGPLVFVRGAVGEGAGGGPELPEVMGPIAQRFDATGIQGMAYGGRRVWDMQCNWKVVCDNYLDGGYHVEVAHPSLAGQLELDAYRTEVYRWSSLQMVPPVVGGHRRIGAGALYAWVYPNLMMNRYGPVLDVNVVVPTGPESCRVLFDFWFEPEALEDPDFIAQTMASSAVTQDEDVWLCESVQRGLASPGYDRGPYAPRVEMAAHAFHCVLARELGVALSTGR
jgi:choline monooxygenase